MYDIEKFYINDEKFVEYFIDSNNCWICHNRKPKITGGYYDYRYKGKNIYLHKLIYALFNKINVDELKGVRLKLTCENQLCINPSHILKESDCDGFNKKSKLWSIDVKELQKIFDNSVSYKDILIKLGYSNLGGGSFIEIKKRIELDNIDETKLILNRKNYIKECSSFSQKKDLNDILVENSTFSRVHLKNRLIKENVLENQCDICGMLPLWNGLSLTLILDHINGINNDNRIENLRLLCPNCNSQQDTFAGRNIKKKK